LFITHIKRLAKEENKIGQKDIFAQFNEKLNNLLKNDRENVILEYFDILAWTESKINDKPFDQAVQDRLKKVLN